FAVAQNQPCSLRLPPKGGATSWFAKFSPIPMPLSPLLLRRLRLFKANRRGYWSLCLFLIIFTLTLAAEFIVNDKPLLVSYRGQLYTPVVHYYPETTFGGDFETEADYRDPYVTALITEHGWMLWPLLRYSYETINYDLTRPPPTPPSRENLLGTDD